MSKRVASKRSQWLVQGFDGLSKTPEWRIDGRVSQDHVQQLLKALVAKVALTLDEIVGAYATQRSQAANSLLRVSRDGPRLRFACGHSCRLDSSGRLAAQPRCWANIGLGEPTRAKSSGTEHC